MGDLISVVVPVYNIQEYVGRCLESILRQTYTDFELLVIDDGSTDNSLAVCNQYLADSRCKVFTKENGGLSDARNYGIERAAGSLITFIDGDDFVEPDYLMHLYECLVQTGSDISVSSLRLVHTFAPVVPSETGTAASRVLFSPLEAIAAFLYQKEFDTSAWGKLYKTDLFASVCYPKGLYFEDLATTYRLFLQAEKIAFVPSADYDYFVRVGSITKSNNLEKKLVIFSILDEMKQVFTEKGIFCGKIQTAWLYRNARIVCDLLKVSEDSRFDAVFKERLSLLSVCPLLSDRNISFLDKAKIMIAKASVSIYRNLAKRESRKNSFQARYGGYNRVP